MPAWESATIIGYVDAFSLFCIASLRTFMRSLILLFCEDLFACMFGLAILRAWASTNIIDFFKSHLYLSFCLFTNRHMFTEINIS